MLLVDFNQHRKSHPTYFASILFFHSTLQGSVFFMMMDGRYFLCISFFFALIQSAAASKDLRKKPVNTAAQNESTSVSPGTLNEEKPVGIFSRRRPLPPQRQNVPKPRPETGSASPGSGRRCSLLMETCSAHTPCCSPCALCHCRLFNTICQCWRLGMCPRKN